ncbi:DUF1786 domain-containing protein [Desulfosoma caldarium]|uniref:Uncharacterized protein (DUF1786 family) n=1 Tax=Desulfosoma caldarium TaxID=610254 RepID=A0A3N1UPQ5_9BACT|nr:DUF1786 domain-containing protein [Desulfosoma caldarium]ROQ90730.1 uncharacterized protein (DUF1786 family) [Desulfosoma caldarium]
MNSARGVLAVDIGTGTQDILCWFEGNLMENATKMVMPSPTQRVAQQLRALREKRQDVVLVGRTMGGGPCVREVVRHLEAGLRVYALPEAALTLHDDLARVQAMGVTVTEAAPNGVCQVLLRDLDLDRIGQAMSLFGVPLPDGVAVAVQDHGFSPKESNRLFRFRYWHDFLHRGGDLQALALEPPPSFMTRMQAVLADCPHALVLDTGIAAILGALLDPRARQAMAHGGTVVNVGNGHTIAALIRDFHVLAIYEHHTGMLNPVKLSEHLRRFRQGLLTQEEVFEDGGHGCAYGPEPLNGSFETTLVTGPRRRQLFEEQSLFAAPFGDMMLTGCFGLLQAALWAQGYGEVLA